MAQPKKTILDVIDGNNWMNRAYYSAPKLTTKRGEHTGAAKAFINMVSSLIKLRTDKRGICNLVVCFDSAKSSGGIRRKQMSKFIGEDKKGAKVNLPEKYLKGYKGTRVHDPVKTQEFSPQFAIVKKFLDARGIKWYEMDDVEADDIIGSLAFQLKCRVMIWSRDKDFAQLLCPSVQITQQGQRNADEVRLTYRNCCEHYGINPEMFVDFLALCGDSSDNIPGIPGVGEKIAIKLLNEYVDLEGILEAAENGKVSGKALSAKLSNPYNKKLLILSRELAEICKTLKVDTKPHAYLIADLINHKKPLKKLAVRYEFTNTFTA